MDGLHRSEAFEKAKSKALRLLTSRPRTAREIVERLASAGFEEDLAEQVAARLTEVGLLNDEMLVRDEVERGLRKGISRASIRQSLERKGVDSGVIEEGLEGSGSETESERAYGLALKKAAALRNVEHQTAYRRLGQFLMGRGFDAETVAEVTNRVLSQRPEEVGGAWAAG